MKVKAVFEINIPDELVKACVEQDREAYDDVFEMFAQAIEVEEEEFDPKTIITDYTFYSPDMRIMFSK